MIGPTRQGINYLLDQASQEPWANQTWSTATMDNPRMVIVPVVEWDEAGNGVTQVRIVGFAVFYSRRCGANRSPATSSANTASTTPTTMPALPPPPPMAACGRCD